MPNKILPINGSSDERSRIAQTNANFAKLDADTITKAYSGPTGKDAVIEGQLPSDLGSGILMNDLNGVPNIYMATTPAGQPVLKVAKAGSNATTATDQDLIFNSARNTFKIVTTGSTTVSFTPPVTLQLFQSVIAHGQPGVPIVIAFIEAGGIRQMLPYETFGYESSLAGGTGGLYVTTVARVIVDSVNLTFQVLATANTAIASPANFKYYILAESAA